VYELETVSTVEYWVATEIFGQLVGKKLRDDSKLPLVIEESLKLPIIDVAGKVNLFVIEKDPNSFRSIRVELYRERIKAADPSEKLLKIEYDMFEQKSQFQICFTEFRIAGELGSDHNVKNLFIDHRCWREAFLIESDRKTIMDVAEWEVNAPNLVREYIFAQEKEIDNSLETNFHDQINYIQKTRNISRKAAKVKLLNSRTLSADAPKFYPNAPELDAHDSEVYVSWSELVNQANETIQKAQTIGVNETLIAYWKKLYKDATQNHREGSQQKLIAIYNAAKAAINFKIDNVPEVPTNVVDKVHFSVTSQTHVRPGDSFVIDIWAHLEKQRKEVVRRAQRAFPGSKSQIRTKGPVKVARGTVLTVRLRISDLTVEEYEDTVLWEGEIGNAQFAISVPQNVSKGKKTGLATIHANGMQIARIYFIIEVGKKTSHTKSLRTKQRKIRKAFASYASDDRKSVLARVQGMEKINPKLEVFVDSVSLQSGQYWGKELWKVIPKQDVFYLFWSRSAARSEWVEKEWRCALKTRGLDFIDPVPLESPEEAPPPPELASKHFNDWMLAFMRNNNNLKE
jgi:hypothetical protein